MHAEAMDIGIDAHYGTITLHNPLVHRVRVQMLRKDLRDVVLDVSHLSHMVCGLGECDS
jgi:hypothetical protein